MKRRSRYRAACDVMDIVVTFVIICVLAMFLFPIVERVRGNYHRASCQSNLRQIAIAAKQYLQDYDGNYPRKYGINPSHPYGWPDALGPYIKTKKLFQCPLTSTYTSEGHVSDYWFNSRLSGANWDDLPYPAWTLFLGDGQVNCGPEDTNYAISSLPAEWRTKTDSPIYRHLEGANYAFADGHVKYYKSNQIQDTKPPSQGLPTFRTGADKPKHLPRSATTGATVSQPGQRRKSHS